MTTPGTENTLKTPFHGLHVVHSAKMVPFAGYELPIQYPEGILREHEWVRTRCGVFDVSHMGQAYLKGTDAAANLSRLTPTSFMKTANDRCKYTVLLNEQGGIIDDLIITRIDETTFGLVVNGARKAVDLPWIEKNLKGAAALAYRGDHAPLIAVQGPYAVQVLKDTLLKNVNLDQHPYMTATTYKILGEPCLVTRTGYTGEDGFELALMDDQEKVHAVWDMLTSHPDCRPIGLGARDSLRLEMGYPLYGHDLDETTSPVEAGISWVISKKNTGFIGEARIRKELDGALTRKRIGIQIIEKGIAREGAELYSTDGKKIGIMTSGGYSPTTKQGIGMGYVNPSHADVGTTILVDVRGRRLRAKVHPLAFVKPSTAQQGA